MKFEAKLGMCGLFGLTMASSANADCARVFEEIGFVASPRNSEPGSPTLFNLGGIFSETQFGTNGSLFSALGMGDGPRQTTQLYWQIPGSRAKAIGSLSGALRSFSPSPTANSLVAVVDEARGDGTGTIDRNIYVTLVSNGKSTRVLSEALRIIDPTELEAVVAGTSGSPNRDATSVLFKSEQGPFQLITISGTQYKVRGFAGDTLLAVSPDRRFALTSLSGDHPKRGHLNLTLVNLGSDVAQPLEISLPFDVKFSKKTFPKNWRLLIDDGGHFVVAYHLRTGAVRGWNVEDQGLKIRTGSYRGAGDNFAVFIDPAATFAVAASGAGGQEAVLHRLKSGFPTVRTLPKLVLDPTFSQDARYLATTHQEGDAWILSVFNLQYPKVDPRQFRIETTFGELKGVRFSPDSSKLIVFGAHSKALVLEL